MDVFALSASISLNLDNFNTNLDRAQKKFKSFSDSISTMSGKIDSIYKGVGEVFQPAVDGFKAVEGVGKKAGNAVTTGLKGFAAAATAVGGFGAAAAKSGMQFDATMSEVSAISGATGQDFQDLRDKALEMGAKTKFSASEAAEAMTYMGMAGWKTKDMLGGIEGIMNLAAASGEDLAITSDIVTDALTAFGMKASDSGHFADVMAVAATNANTNVGMMGETFKYVAPVAGSLGYSVEDASLAIGLMANSSIKASQAGTSLRSIMTRLATNAGATKNEMGAAEILTEKLGVSFYDTAGNARALSDVLLEAREAWQGLGDEEATYYAKKIAGQEAISGWLAIMNASTEDVDNLTTALENANGAAEKMATTMVDNLQGDVTLMKSAFESLQIAISDSLTPTLREFAQFGQKAMAGLLEGFQGSGVSGFMSALSGIVTNGVTMLSQKAPEFASVSLQFVGALGEGMINAAPQIFNSLYEVKSTLISGLRSFLDEHSNDLVDIGNGILNTILTGFLAGSRIIRDYIGDFVPLIVRAFADYHSTLFTIGIEILGAIGEGLVGNKELIQENISQTVFEMVYYFKENAPMIIEGGLALLESLVGAIEENLPLIVETGAEIIGQLVAGIATASPAVQAIIGTVVLPHILKIVDTVDKISGAVGKVVEFSGKGIEKVISIGGKLMGGISKLFALIAANPVVAIVTGIIAAVVLLYTKCEWFRDGVHAIIDAVVGLFKGAWEAVQAVWSAAGEFFGGIVDGIKTAFDGIGEFLGGLFTAAWEMVQGAWKAATEFFSGIADGIHEVFEAVTSFLGDTFSAAWDAVSGAWDAAVGFFGDIWDNISGAAKKAGEAVGKAFKGAWDAVKKAWGGAINFFSGIAQKIVGAFSGIGGKFLDIGRNIVDGIKNGIAGAWDAFMGWLNNKVGGIVQGVKNMLGIHSPSTVFAGIGENMALGLAAGWDDEYNGIKRKIESGLNFGTASVGVNTNYSGSSRYGAQEAAGRPGGWGNTTVNIYSPEAVDGVQAARVWKKEAQRMAISYV